MNTASDNPSIVVQIRQRLSGVKPWRRTVYAYTLLFLIVFCVAFSAYLLGGRSFIWRTDGEEAIFQGLIYRGKWIRTIISNFSKGDFTIPQYDLSLGWGGDALGADMDPLVLLLAPLFTADFAELLYGLLFFLRMYLAGMAYLYMCRFFERGGLRALAGCFVYVFCSYAIYSGTGFGSYLNPMIQLPLLIVGAEKVMRRQRGLGFAFAVMYTAMCGYYHLYIQTVLVGVYCVVRLFALYDRGQRLRALPKVLGHGVAKYLLGLGLSAWCLLPAMLGFTAAGRSGFSNLHVSADLGLHWRYFWRRLEGLISPVAYYDWDWGMEYPGFAAVFLLAAVMLYTGERRRRDNLKWLVGIALFMLFCPWCGWIMNGFQYACNRWSFGLALVAGFLVTDKVDELFRMTPRQKAAGLVCICLYGCVALFAADIRATLFATLGAGFLTATFLMGVLGEEEGLFHRCRRGMCLALVCVNVCANAVFLCAPEAMGWSRLFAPSGYETQRLSMAVESEAVYSPYGYDITKGRVDSTLFSYNDAQVYGVPGTLIYTPLLNGNVVDYWIETEGSGNVQYFKIYSTDQRTIQNTLLAVNQQFETGESANAVPYGYTNLGKTLLNTEVYQNNYALPWGYTYDRSVSREALEGRNGIDKQEIMLQAVVLEPDGQPGDATPGTANQRIPYTCECLDCTWENGVLDATSGSAVIQLKAELPAGREYYVRLKGFNIDGYGDDFLTISTSASFNFSVRSGDVYKFSRAMDRAYPWYYGRENYLFCLGCLDTDRDSVEISIPAEGVFGLEDIELYALPLDGYPAQVEKLRAEPMENIKIETNRIAGTVDLSKEKVLCLAIPFDKGWTAYVDGEKAEILKANYAFMGLRLNEGHHDIAFVYHTPYLREGALVTAVGLVLAAAWILRGKRKQRA